MKEPDYNVEIEQATLWIDEMQEFECRLTFGFEPESDKITISAVDDISEMKSRDKVLIEFNKEHVRELVEYLQNFT